MEYNIKGTEKSLKLNRKVGNFVLSDSKKFVIDSSVLLSDEEAIFKFGDNELIIPSIVWEELNDKKDNSEDPTTSFLARKVLRILNDLSDIRPLREGIRLNEILNTSAYYNEAKDVPTLIRVDYRIDNEEVDSSFKKKKNDYKIIGCAKNNEAILVTSDIPMLSIAKDFVKAEEYKAGQIKSKTLYKGYRFVTESPDIIEQLYDKNVILEDKWDLYPNEFIIIVDATNEGHKGIGIKKRNFVKPVNFDKELNLSGMKTKPVNLEQKMFLYLLQDPDILCVTVSGISGKGKTLLSCDYALSQVKKGLYNEFLYTKSITPMDDDEYMGYNKGSEDEKFSAHIKALFTTIEYLFKEELVGPNKKKTVSEKMEELMAREELGTLPLAGIRGMNIFQKVVLLDEAQNTKRHTIKTLVSRLTDESKLIVSGDIEQIDDSKLNEFNNGLSHLIEQGKEEDFIGHITFDIDKGNSKRGKLSTFGSKKL